MSFWTLEKMTEKVNLYCVESDTDGSSQILIMAKKEAKEKILLSDDRTLVNMLQSEENYLPSPSCFMFQKDIGVHARRTVAQWMLEVCEEQKREEEVFPLAINFLDRILSCHETDKSRLQLLAAVCLFIASKLKEAHPFDAMNLVAYTDFSIDVQDLLEWEMLVLQILKWELCAVIPHDYLHHFVSRLDVDQAHASQIIRHAQTFIALCATEFSFAIQPASVLACASICTALSGLNSKSWCEETSLYEQLRRMTCIEIECIRTCQEQIEQLLTRHVIKATAEENSESDFVATLSTARHQKTRSSNTPTDVSDIILF